MNRIVSPRAALYLLAAAAVALLIASSLPSASASAPVTVRVEGPARTLLAATAVRLNSAAVVKDGVKADSCSGTSAAGALQEATAGRWVGTWSKSFKGYLLTGIDGVSFSSSGGQFWAFWINDKPASLGICGYDPKPGDSLLFFPDCYGKKCPPNDGVLGIKAAATAVVGKPFAVKVTAYNDAKGAPSAKSGAHVSGGGASATTSASGAATLSFAHSGRVTIDVTAAHAVRTEASVCVAASAGGSCG
ncbi:MAG TPA: DUF4430 domain-containing protein [Solirubrobacteraceae bacterium]|jgi:hypothetical protein|nr:DUF4430 domain-containing protein [Solirubrobacteraceae bacterium]